MTEDKVPCPRCEGIKGYRCEVCGSTGNVTSDFRREFLEAQAREEERETLLDHAVDIVYNLANDELRTFIAQHESTKEIPR